MCSGAGVKKKLVDLPEKPLKLVPYRLSSQRVLRLLNQLLILGTKKALFHAYFKVQGNSSTFS